MGIANLKEKALTKWNTKTDKQQKKIVFIVGGVIALAIIFVVVF